MNVLTTISLTFAVWLKVIVVRMCKLMHLQSFLRVCICSLFPQTLLRCVCDCKLLWKLSEGTLQVFSQLSLRIWVIWLEWMHLFSCWSVISLSSARQKRHRLFCCVYLFSTSPQITMHVSIYGEINNCMFFVTFCQKVNRVFGCCFKLLVLAVFLDFFVVVQGVKTFSVDTADGIVQWSTYCSKLVINHTPHFCYSRSSITLDPPLSM